MSAGDIKRGARRRRRAAAKRRPRRRPASGRAGDRPDLNEAARALLGDDPARRAREPRPNEQGSIEDPLRDWPPD
jgi:hypothetical protein